MVTGSTAVGKRFIRGTRNVLKIYCPDSLSEDLLDDADAHSLMLQLVRDVRTQLLDLDVEKFAKRGLQCRRIDQTTPWLPAGWLAGDTPLSLTTLEPGRYTHHRHCPVPPKKGILGGDSSLARRGRQSQENPPTDNSYFSQQHVVRYTLFSKPRRMPL